MIMTRKTAILLALISGVVPATNAASASNCCIYVKIDKKKPIPKKPVKTIAKTVKDVAEHTKNTVARTSENVIKAGSKGAGDIIRTTGTAINDTSRAVGRAGTDARKTVAKAATDSLREGDRAWTHTVEAVQASGRYLERYVSDSVHEVTKAEQRIREGKIADAFFHLAVDPWTNAEDRAFRLASESSLVNAVGQVASGVYGGPAGAAAYAAWYTYRTTGDAALAIRVGIISGATSAAIAAVAPATPTMAEASQIARSGAAIPAYAIDPGDTVKRALLTGALGGVAVAASGGDEAAIRDGFLRGGAMVLVQDGYRSFTQQQGFYAEGAERPGLCTASMPEVGPAPPCAPKLEWLKRDSAGQIVRENGVPVLDMGKVPPDTSFIGLPANANSSVFSNLPAESGPVMSTIAKIPGMNAMSIFHDQWVISWDMTSIATKAPTIIPAIAITYMGTEAPLQQAIASAGFDRSKSPPSNGEPQRVSEHSYLLFKGDLSRAIFLSQGETTSDLACVVVYQKDDAKDDLAPWHALNDRNYCADKADTLAASLASDGWTVLVR